MVANGQIGSVPANVCSANLWFLCSSSRPSGSYRIRNDEDCYEKSASENSSQKDCEQLTDGQSAFKQFVPQNAAVIGQKR